MSKIRKNLTYLKKEYLVCLVKNELINIVLFIQQLNPKAREIYDKDEQVYCYF